MKKKLAIICPANYPVPSVKGGAIETLIDVFVEQNEIYGIYDVVLYSYFDELAFKESKKYNNTKFVYIKERKYINKIYNFFRKVIRKVFKIEIDSIFLKNVIKDIEKNNIKEVVIEGNIEYVIPIKKSNENINIYLHIHHEAFKCFVNKTSKISRISNSCKKIITVSDYVTKETRIIDGINDEKVVTLNNCTNINLFTGKNHIDSKDELRRKYGINKSDKVILFSGRILPIKGIKELIIAFKKYCLELDAKLLVVGDAGFASSIKSEYDDELIELSKDISDKIIFTGFIHNKDLPNIHSITDIAVVPSMWDEPAGLVVLEAMASKLPLIVTRSGGITEYVDNTCAIIVERDEDVVDNIGKALVELIKNDKRRKSMGESGRLRAENYSWDSYYSNFIDILSYSEESIEYK